tara:strand:+ start:5284 stop:5481 length:198 start_codon:yes stop_codon:yes gene_type:complete
MKSFKYSAKFIVSDLLSVFNESSSARLAKLVFLTQKKIIRKNALFNNKKLPQKKEEVVSFEEVHH